MIIASVIILEQCPLRLLHPLLILVGSKSDKFLREKKFAHHKKYCQIYLTLWLPIILTLANNSRTSDNVNFIKNFYLHEYGKRNFIKYAQNFLNFNIQHIIKLLPFGVEKAFQLLHKLIDQFTTNQRGKCFLLCHYC